MARVRLREGHVRPLWAGHPWVFAQAIDEVNGAPSPGDPIDVVDPKGKYIGSGYWSPSSAIPIRILSRNKDEVLDARAIEKRIKHAVAWRRSMLNLPSDSNTGFRLVHSEGDDLGGLIIDIYGGCARIAVGTIGMHKRIHAIVAALAQQLNLDSIILAACDLKQKEGFACEASTLRGLDVSQLDFRERGFHLQVESGEAKDIGFYFDQRNNRQRVEELAKGRRVLDAFCFLGGFSLSAARGGATQVVALDRSAASLAAASRIARHNGQAERIEFRHADVKNALPDLARRKERFDMVLVSPPKLSAGSRKKQAAERAYRRVNANAISLIERGGLLVSSSSSASFSEANLLRAVALAGRDAGRSVSVLEIGHQGADHPSPAAFPQGRHLKCIVARVY